VSRRRTLGASLLGLGMLFALLAIPSPAPHVADAPPGARSFVWDQDAYWQSLEVRLAAARDTPCARTELDAMREVAALDSLLYRMRSADLDPEAQALDTLERRYFELGPSAAVCPGLLDDYVRLQGLLREVVKDQSRRWDMASVPARERIYRALYGSRTAVEEVMLHHSDRILALVHGRDEPSATPGTMVQGVRVHSGDMLVSRGGYPTSALIARGNDLPGNFSHVALVHVDSATGAASTIEAHIERGVSIATAEEYLRDKKLRIMVLRPRADLPWKAADPMLPHRAASRALERARSEHVPYDFAMDYTDPSRLFCSEVASSVYRDLGVTLWTGLSTISAPGLRRWLAAFGVRHFETQEPSDLEYDPQLVVVAEWRDPARLLADRVDNAVIDAMLEGAEAGDALEYDWYRLPPARLAKAFSWILQQAGGTGPVPEGMSAEAALRNQAFSARQRALAADVTRRADAFAADRGYPAPYWVLVEMARVAAGLSPAPTR
jgi:hypothetical protein